MALIAHSHITLDEQGVAWIDDANVKVIETTRRAACFRDADLLAEATQRQRVGRSFA